MSMGLLSVIPVILVYVFCIAVIIYTLSLFKRIVVAIEKIAEKK